MKKNNLASGHTTYLFLGASAFSLSLVAYRFAQPFALLCEFFFAHFQRSRSLSRPRLVFRQALTFYLESLLMVGWQCVPAGLPPLLALFSRPSCEFEFHQPPMVCALSFMVKEFWRVSELCYVVCSSSLFSPALHF
jgi:hypothetical protein